MWGMAPLNNTTRKAPPSSVLEERSPGAIAWIANVFGGGAPSLQTGFTYLDLGCGRGINIAVFADMYKHGRFYGVDPSAENIAEANAISEKFWQGNTVFHECALDKLEELELPEFDFISISSAYVNLSVESRRYVIAMIKRLLKPGGAIVIRYGAMPGAMPFSIMSNWGQMLMPHFSGSDGEKTKTAMSEMARLFDKHSLISEGMPTFPLIIESAQSRDADYMSNYFSQEADPLWHHDVVENMTAAGLHFAGSSVPEHNQVTEISPPQIAATLSAFNDKYNDRVLREEYFNILSMITTRSDVFCHKEPHDTPSLEAAQDFYLCPVSTKDPDQILAEINDKTAVDLTSDLYSTCYKAVNRDGEKVGFLRKKRPDAFSVQAWDAAIVHLTSLNLLSTSPNPMRSVAHSGQYTASNLLKFILKEQMTLDEEISVPAKATGMPTKLSKLERWLCLALVDGGLKTVWDICVANNMKIAGPNNSGPIQTEAEFISAYGPVLKNYEQSVAPTLLKRGIIARL